MRGRGPNPNNIRLSPKGFGEQGVVREVSRFGASISTGCIALEDRLRILYGFRQGKVMFPIASIDHHFDLVGNPLNTQILLSPLGLRIRPERGHAQWYGTKNGGVVRGEFSSWKSNTQVSFNFEHEGLKFLIQHPFYPAPEIWRELGNLDNCGGEYDQGALSGIHHAIKHYETLILHI